MKFSIEDIDAAYPGQTAESIAMATLDGPTQAVLVTRGGIPSRSTATTPRLTFLWLVFFQSVTPREAETRRWPG